MKTPRLYPQCNPGTPYCARCTVSIHPIMDHQYVDGYYYCSPECRDFQPHAIVDTQDTTAMVVTYCSICSIIPVYGDHTVCVHCLRPTAQYHHHRCGDCSTTIMCDLAIGDCNGCGDSDLCMTCINKRIGHSLDLLAEQKAIITAYDNNHQPYSWDAVVYEGVATLDNGLRVSSKFDTYDDMLCWLAEHSEYGIVGWVDNVQIDALKLQNDVARYLESI